MNFSSDTRGVSEVLGAILVFALVLTVLVIVQVAGVPAANQQIEFEHNARVQSDFQEFDQSIDQMAATGAGESVNIESGVRYPPRLFLINPGPAAGTVSTGEMHDVTFGNVEALNEETAQYFSGEVVYDPGSTSLTYGPTYNEYTSAPTTVYEHGILYNSDDSGISVFDRGNVVNGNRISLTVLEGDISSSSTRSVAVPMSAVSGPSQTVTISSVDDSQPITITVYTGLSESVWQDQILANEPHATAACDDNTVPATTPCNGPLTISLDGDRTYDLRLAKIGVGSGYSEEGTKYLTKVGSTNPVINRGGTELIVEARDAFNNGVAGEAVTFESDDGKFVKPDNTKVETLEVTTDEAGRASVKFVPENDKTSATITASGEFDGDDTVTSDLEEVEYTDLQVESENPTDLTEDDINPSGTGFVVQTGAVIDKVNSDDYVDVSFENRIPDDWELVQIRINYYFVGSSSGNGKVPDTVDLELPSGASDTLAVGGDYEVLSESITFEGSSTTPWNTETLRFSNWQGPNQFSGPEDQDFFIVTMLFDTDGEEGEDERGVYFVGPRSA